MSAMLPAIHHGKIDHLFLASVLSNYFNYKIKIGSTEEFAGSQRYTVGSEVKVRLGARPHTWQANNG
jgi:hypothetical protein